MGRCLGADIPARDRAVLVTHGWCACGHGRVIDLDKASFAALAPPSVGVLRVVVTWGEAIALPATDTVAPRRTHGWALLS